MGEKLRGAAFVGTARGSFVDTAGRREEAVRRQIQEQEAEDRRLEQLELPSNNPG